MSIDGANVKLWALTPAKITEAVTRLVATASRPQRLIGFGSPATGGMAAAKDLDLIVATQESYDSRAQVPGKVEFAARTEGPVCSMTPVGQDRLLLLKGAQDQAVLERLVSDPIFEPATLGFQAQQTAEKLLKALLASALEEAPGRRAWPQLLPVLEAHVSRAIQAAESPPSSP